MSLAIGVDIGGTKVAAGLVSETGEILRRERRPTPSTDPAAVAAVVASVVADLRAESDVSAVGVGAAGFIDADRSTVLFAPNLAWRQEPLRDSLSSLIGLPVVVENDANAMAWAEYRFGAGVGVSSLVALTVGTGIGAGLVLDGHLYRGAFGMAGEPGHLRVVPDGLPCGCGNRGCWEMYASGSALMREARDLIHSGSPHAAALSDACGGEPDRLRGIDITALAEQGDAAAGELLADLGRWVGEGAASVAAILDPELIVLGGGVSEAGELLLEPARAAFRRQLTGRGHRPEARFALATLGNSAGIIGAAALAAEGVGS